jgi:hypothetical protein
MLSLGTLIQQVKRKTRYGDIATTTDQATADIVHYINQRSQRLWRRYNWGWSILEFTLSIVASTINYTLGATVGDIIAIENSNGGYLNKRTIKRYLQWHKSGSTDDNSGSTSDYMRMGLDSTTKAIKIKVWPTPSTSASLTGWGKVRIVPYAVSDIAANTYIAYFPEEVLPVLEAGVLADIYEAQAKTAEHLEKEAFFNSEMEKMVKEEASEADSEEEIPAPDYFTFHKRKRGGTTVT